MLFAFLELVEMMRSGLVDYCQDLWNVMDWVNFFFFFLTYMQARHPLPHPCMHSPLRSHGPHHTLPLQTHPPTRPSRTPRSPSPPRLHSQIHAVNYFIYNRDCSSYLCTQIGYFDDWRLMKEYKSTKIYISLCVCIQLFKVIKFTSQLVPKMSLMTSVLRQCIVDLIFFGVVFFNSVIAFSMMLYVQVRPRASHALPCPSMPSR